MLKINNLKAKINNKSILNLFTRIKSFLMALVNGFRGAGFMTPESIFNHIEAGLVGQRIKTQNETMDIYTSKNIDQMMLQNPRGDIVLSHHFMNTPETRQMQLAYLELMLGDKLMRNGSTMYSEPPGFFQSWKRWWYKENQETTFQ